MKAKEAHLFPLFNPVAFNSQQTFIPINFLHSISVSKCAFQGSKLLHQGPLPPPPPKPNFPLPPTSSFNSCQAILPLALLICEFSSGALSPLSKFLISLLGLFNPYHLQGKTRSTSKGLSQTLHPAMSAFLIHIMHQYIFQESFSCSFWTSLVIVLARFNLLPEPAAFPLEPWLVLLLCVCCWHHYTHPFRVDSVLGSLFHLARRLEVNFLFNQCAKGILNWSFSKSW